MKNILGQRLFFLFFFFSLWLFKIYTDEKENLALFLNLSQLEKPFSPNPPKAEDSIFSSNELKSLGLFLINFYQIFISTQDIPVCPFYPTCSDFAKQAINQYGIIIGLILAADRFQRCNGMGIHYYPYAKNLSRYLDLVEWNLP